MGLSRDLKPCAAVGCGGIVFRNRNSLYCDDCVSVYPFTRALDFEQPTDCDIPRVLLREARDGGRKHKIRLKRFGPGKCYACGGNTLPGRLYCSDRCRGDARFRRSGWQAVATVELDGIVASPHQHARRIGLPVGTLSGRLRRGMTPLEALTAPVDERGRALRAGVRLLNGRGSANAASAEVPLPHTVVDPA